MPELEDQIAKEAARQNAADGTTPPVETTQITTPVNTPEVPEGQSTPAADATVVVTPEGTEGSNANNQDDPVIFGQMLERFSNGLFKSPDELTAAATKLGLFDNLNSEVETLRTAALSAPKFADEFEQKRNELKLSGASKETLKTFEKLNDLGDLSQLDPIEAKVMKLVLVDGMGEKIARLKVEKQFPLESTFDEDDKAIMEEDLRLSAKEDLKALSAFQVEISTPVAKDDKLVNEAAKIALTNSLKPVLENLQTNFNVLTTLNLGGKEGVPAATLDLSLSADDKAFFAQEIQAYMVGNNLPVNQENFNEALAVAREKYVATNLSQITSNVWKKAETHFTKLFTDKYENLGGKPRSETPAGVAAGMSQEEKAFKKSLLGGELR